MLPLIGTPLGLFLAIGFPKVFLSRQFILCVGSKEEGLMAWAKECSRVQHERMGDATALAQELYSEECKEYDGPSSVSLDVMTNEHLRRLARSLGALGVVGGHFPFWPRTFLLRKIREVGRSIVWGDCAMITEAVTMVKMRSPSKVEIAQAAVVTLTDLEVVEACAMRSLLHNKKFSDMAMLRRRLVHYLIGNGIPFSSIVGASLVCRVPDLPLPSWVGYDIEGNWSVFPPPAHPWPLGPDIKEWEEMAEMTAQVHIIRCFVT
mmetsp:Transcript_26801/g.61698  ORF Transcript_26801/g.61698 Transcript_26801/m.61698 type:complete len:263 (-) Transcript_26801:463-1251(-)